jgi:hypothetical protein
MKIEFDMEDNSIIYDVFDGIFVALLKRQLKDSKNYLETAYHEEDIKNNKANIEACKVLLAHYTGKDDETA